jgi:hypothetical protein
MHPPVALALGRIQIEWPNRPFLFDLKATDLFAQERPAN